MLPKKVKYLIDPNIIIRYSLPISKYLKLLDNLNRKFLGKHATKICRYHLNQSDSNFGLIEFRRYLITEKLFLIGEFIVDMDNKKILDIKSNNTVLTCSLCDHETQSVHSFLQHIKIKHNRKLKELDNHFFPKQIKQGKQNPKYRWEKIGVSKFKNREAGKEDAFFKRLPGSFGSGK